MCGGGGGIINPHLRFFLFYPHLASEMSAQTIYWLKNKMRAPTAFCSPGI
jgi:hypothetical protein